MPLATYLKQACFLIFSLIFFGTLIFTIIQEPKTLPHEFGPHISVARQMDLEQRLLSPHFLFHVLTIAQRDLLKAFHVPDRLVPNRKSDDIEFTWHLAGWLVTMAFILGTLLALQIYFQRRFRFAGLTSYDNLSYFLAFSLCIIMPVFILAPLDGKYYLGYMLPSTSYVIPTQLALRLPALLLFFCAPFLFSAAAVNHVYRLLGLALLVVVCGLIKPSFLIIMLPALGVLTVFRVIYKQDVNWPGLAVVLFASLLTLGWQFYFQFIDGAGLYKSSVEFTKPFAVMAHHSQYIALKLVLSLLFPAYVVYLCRSKLSDLRYQYAGLLFAFGMFYSIFLAESGRFKFAGNFIWSGQIATFILFVAALEVFVLNAAELRKNRQKAFYTGIIIYLLHVLFGLIYYIRSFWFDYH